MKLSSIKYLFSLKHVRAYITSKLITPTDYMNPSVILQLALRFGDPDCKQCYLENKCLDCGCDMPEKALDFKMACSLEYWQAVNKDLPFADALEMFNKKFKFKDDECE